MQARVIATFVVVSSAVLVTASIAKGIEGLQSPIALLEITAAVVCCSCLRYPLVVIPFKIALWTTLFTAAIYSLYTNVSCGCFGSLLPTKFVALVDVAFLILFLGLLALPQLKPVTRIGWGVPFIAAATFAFLLFAGNPTSDPRITANVISKVRVNPTTVEYVIEVRNNTPNDVDVIGVERTCSCTSVRPIPVSVASNQAVNLKCDVTKNNENQVLRLIHTGRLNSRLEVVLHGN